MMDSLKGQCNFSKNYTVPELHLNFATVTPSPLSARSLGRKVPHTTTRSDTHAGQIAAGRFTGQRSCRVLPV